MLIFIYFFVIEFDLHFLFLLLFLATIIFQSYHLILISWKLHLVFFLFAINISF